MSIRNLDAVFKPGAVALIGASNRPQSIGGVVARNLFSAGFAGPVMPVNPKYQAVSGVLAYPDIASLPIAPDLVVICTPPETVPGLVAAAAARGARGAVVITAGFGEGDSARGAALRQEMLHAAKPSLLRIVGPNCFGVMMPGIGLNASFAHVAPRKGDLAFVAQSGAVMASVLDWTMTRNIGFSAMVSIGDMADVDFGDLLDFLANDGHTRAILLYVEAVTHARKFMSAARAASRIKPVIVVKAGRHAEGARAASSHTGALAGVDAVYHAAFRRAGLLRAYDLEELFDAVETLASPPPIRGDRLAILSNGGGIGVLATDALIDLGGRLAELSPATLAALSQVLPPTWSHGNPVDIIGDAPGSRYAAALEALLADRGTDAILVLNCPTALASSLDAAQAVVATLGDKRQPVLTSWVGSSAAEGARALFAAHRVPTFGTPEQAVRGFMHLVRHRRNQAMLMQTPPSVASEIEPDAARARAVLTRALAAGRSWLGEAEAKEVLASYGIPVARTAIAASPAEAEAKAREIGGPLALKILSPDILHKSDVGGVALNLETPAELRAAADGMLARVRKALPQARIEGFTVQEMVRRPGAHELIVGVSLDAQFGPVLLFGHGGTAVEVIDDKALALPPLNLSLARDLMSRTRVFRLLQGYRDRPPVDLDAVALTLLEVSAMACDLAELAELDINPLLADARGVIALDARIRVVPAEGGSASARLAIRPYPKELEQAVALADGGTALLRPVRPEDEPMFHEAFARLSPEDVRLRFFAVMKHLDHEMAARLTQIDYDREMAFILEHRTAGGAGELLGVVRLAADPDNVRAEYAVIVRSDVKGQGLGYLLMTRLIDYARARGLQVLYGDILKENAAMLQMCHELGFHVEDLAETPAIVRATLKL